MAGRIETYVHSDNSTPNKAVAVVEVSCQTDFSARTDEFIAFSKAATKYAFASQSTNWDDVIAFYPGVEDQRLRVKAAIKEKVVVSNIFLHQLGDEAAARRHRTQFCAV